MSLVVLFMYSKRIDNWLYKCTTKINDEEDDSNIAGTIEPVALMPVPVVEENENVYREEVVLSPQLRRRAAAAAAAERRLNLKRTTSAEVEVEDSLEL